MVGPRARLGQMGAALARGSNPIGRLTSRFALLRAGADAGSGVGMVPWKGAVRHAFADTLGLCFGF